MMADRALHRSSLVLLAAAMVAVLVPQTQAQAGAAAAAAETFQYPLASWRRDSGYDFKDQVDWADVGSWGAPCRRSPGSRFSTPGSI